jgi:hypothetical protein
MCGLAILILLASWIQKIFVSSGKAISLVWLVPHDLNKKNINMFRRRDKNEDRN